MSTTFTITESSGIGPSHLDVLIDETVSIEVELPSPSESLAPIGGCPTNQRVQPDAPTRASGSSAAVQTEILDDLPEWRARLSVCDVAAQSSLQLASDNFMNTGFTVSCTTVPTAAMQRDGDGNRPHPPARCRSSTPIPTACSRHAGSPSRSRNERAARRRIIRDRGERKTGLALQSRATARTRRPRSAS